MAIPPNFTIKVHEDSRNTANLVLAPPASLAESDLETASGGAVYKWNAAYGNAGIDEAFTFWDDVGGPTYIGGPQHNAD